MILWKGEHLILIIKPQTTTFQGAPDRTRFPPNAASLTLANEIRVQTSMLFTEAPSPNMGITGSNTNSAGHGCNACHGCHGTCPIPKNKKHPVSSLGGRDVQSLEQVGRKFDSTGGIGCHGIHLLYHHGRKSTFPNRLVNQTAKRLVEAQPNPLCLPGSGLTWSWKDIQPQTNDVRCQMRGQYRSMIWRDESIL